MRSGTASPDSWGELRQHPLLDGSGVAGADRIGECVQISAGLRDQVETRCCPMSGPKRVDPATRKVLEFIGPAASQPSI